MTVITLIVAAIIFAIIALLLAFWPGFPMRELMLEQSLDNPENLLVAIISLFGVLSASFIAAVILIRIQTYSVRRDQLLRNIERIYEPLYTDLITIIKATEHFDDVRFRNEGYRPNWDSISQSPAGVIFEHTDAKFYKRVVNLFKDSEEYNNKLNKLRPEVYSILSRLVEQRITLNNQEQDRKALVSRLAGHLAYIEKLSYGLLVSKSIGEWSALFADQSEEEYINNILEFFRQDRFIHLAPNLANPIEMKVMLEQAIEAVQANTGIKEKKRWCNTFYKQAEQIKKELEKRIVKPQLH